MKQEKYLNCLDAIARTKREIASLPTIDKLPQLINDLDDCNRDERLLSKNLTDAEINEVLYIFARGGGFIQ